MSDMKFYYIGLSETSRNCLYLQDEDQNPKRFICHFMSHKLDSITSCNEHDTLLGPFQYGGIASLYNGKLTRRKKASGKDPSGLEIWI